MPDDMAGAVVRTDNILDEFSDYIIAVRTRKASPANEEAARRCVFDALSCGAAGIDEIGPTAIRQSARSLLSTGNVPIWFKGQSSSVIGAAWANAAATSALDMDDGNRIARGHPGAAVIPAALAVGLQVGATHDAIIQSIVIGYEVGVTVADARKVYGSTGTWATYAVIATAAALKGTSKAVISHAMAIAGEASPSQLFASAPAPRTPAPEGSQQKEGIPWAVATALASLDMAENGYTGPRNILNSLRDYDFSSGVHLGTYDHIQRSYFKRYACCRHIHPPLDALAEVLEDHSIDPSAITSIEVETTSGALRITNKVTPKNLIDAQYSIPYCLAVLAYRSLGALLPLDPEDVQRPDILALAKRVTLKVDPEANNRFPAETLARVIVSHNGKRLTSSLTSPKGEWTKPFSWDELEDKFRACTRYTVPPSLRSRLLCSLREARWGDVSTLSSSLCLDIQALTPRSPKSNT